MKEVSSTAEPLVQQEYIALVNDNEVKKMKMDVLKSELRKCSLSTSGKKAELLERQKKAMVDKISMTAAVTWSLAPNGFDQRARWRLLSGSEVVDEPENQDPTLLDPSQARDRRTKRGVSDENQDIIEKEVVLVTKKIILKNFDVQHFQQ